MREFITRNVKLKVLALAFSFALWFFVAGQAGTEVGFVVPLAYKGSARDLHMSVSSVEDVDVRVAGPKFLINNVLHSQIVPELDLKGAREGKNTLRLSVRDVVVPSGLKVARVLPAIVEVNMERLVEVEIPVKVSIAGKPPRGWRVTGVVSTPRTITVGVLKKNRGAVTALYTRPVDVSDMRASSTVQAVLDIPVNDVKSVAGDTVKVQITLARERM